MYTASKQGTNGLSSVWQSNLSRHISFGPGHSGSNGRPVHLPHADWPVQYNNLFWIHIAPSIFPAYLLTSSYCSLLWYVALYIGKVILMEMSMLSTVLGIIFLKITKNNLYPWCFPIFKTLHKPPFPPNPS